MGLPVTRRPKEHLGNDYKDPDRPFADMNDLVPADTNMGPAMRALSPKARAFVLALVELGGRNQREAATRAGYAGSQDSVAVSASRLAADPRVQAALVEEAKALARSASLAAVANTILIMNDESVGKQVRLNAAGRIMALAALEPEKTTNVNHLIEVKPTTKEQIDQVVRMASDVGMDPRKLLGKAGIVLDAEFKVVGTTAGLEDMLG